MRLQFLEFANGIFLARLTDDHAVIDVRHPGLTACKTHVVKIIEAHYAPMGGAQALERVDTLFADMADKVNVPF